MARTKETPKIKPKNPIAQRHRYTPLRHTLQWVQAEQIRWHRRKIHLQGMADSQVPKMTLNGYCVKMGIKLGKPRQYIPALDKTRNIPYTLGWHHKQEEEYQESK